MKAMIATGKPVVVILTSGSAVAINSAAAGAAAVLSAWYGGEEAGTAIADTLAGVNNPAGRLPVTFYKSLDQLPEFTDYSMKGRTYRYFKGEPLYPFGYGLSYSTFAYSGLNAKRTAGGAEISATVKNTSSREGDEVVQLYIGGGAEKKRRSGICADSSGFTSKRRKPPGEVHVGGRGRPDGEGGYERWRRTAHRQHAVCEGFPVAAGPKTRFRLKGFMRRGFIHSVVLVSLAAAPLSAADPVLWYRHPASRWGDALPIGNGRLGGMVFGGIAKERIALNEDTIWNGKKRDRVNPEALKALPEVRRLLFEGKVKEAEALEEQKMMGIPNRQPPYQPLGDLNIEFTGLDNAQDYRRELNLATGVARVSYRVGDTACTREIFSSAPDQAIVVRLSCDKPGQLTFRATLTRSQDAGTTTAAPDRVILAGEAIAHTNFWISPNLTPEKRKAETDQLEPSGVRFRSVLRAVNEGGKVEIAGADVVVTGANAATLLLVAATDYRGGDPAVACDHYLTRAAKSYDALKSRAPRRSREDSSGAWRWCRCRHPAVENLPTDERLARLKKGQEDPGLSALYFQFGRYLLMGSSRPGTMAANLQGIWNELMSPPWDSKYTTNINLQMNYWPAEVGNLPETTGPLFDLVKMSLDSGRRTAKEMYGARGFAFHHNHRCLGRYRARRLRLLRHLADGRRVAGPPFLGALSIRPGSQFPEPRRLSHHEGSLAVSSGLPRRRR